MWPDPRRRWTTLALTWGYHSGFISALSLTGTLCALMWLLGGRIDSSAATAYGALIWLLTVGDRLAENPEDRGSDATTPATLVRRHRRLFTALQVALTCLLVVLFAIQPRIGAAIAFTGFLCAFYFVRIPGLGLRIKQLPHAKPLIVPVVMLATQLAFCGFAVPWTVQGASCCALLLLQYHAGLVLYDLKDLAADRSAGIRTLASRMTRARFLGMEAAILAGCAALALTLPWPIGPALACGFAGAIGGVVVLHHRTFGIRMCAYLDGVLGLGPWLGVAVVLV